MIYFMQKIVNVIYMIFCYVDKNKSYIHDFFIMQIRVNLTYNGGFFYVDKGKSYKQPRTTSIKRKMIKFNDTLPLVCMLFGVPFKDFQSNKMSPRHVTSFRSRAAHNAQGVLYLTKAYWDKGPPFLRTNSKDQ